MEKKVLKYDPLMEYLKRERAKGLNRVALTFEQINLIIDDELPDSAKDYKAWCFGHPCQDHAWKDAGYSDYAGCIRDAVEGVCGGGKKNG